MDDKELWIGCTAAVVLAAVIVFSLAVEVAKGIAWIKWAFA